MIWQMIGYLLIGGVFGYGLKRWQVLWLPLLFIIGAGLVIDPQIPDFKMDGSWWNSLAMIAGVWVGTIMAER